MASNKASLQGLFETGDIPTGADYANFIDSCVNLAETSAQTMQGPLIATEIITPRVSATNLNVTAVLSAAVANITTVNATLLNGSGLFIAGAVSAATVNVTGDVSAATGSVYASATRSFNGVFQSVGIVSALGTAQASAAPLVFVINRGAGVVDGTTTGFVIPANRTGLTQYILNGAASANLWPPTGGTINALGANAAFAMAASNYYTIGHIAASAYAVK